MNSLFICLCYCNAGVAGCGRRKEAERHLVEGGGEVLRDGLVQQGHHQQAGRAQQAGREVAVVLAARSKRYLSNSIELV